MPSRSASSVSRSLIAPSSRWSAPRAWPTSCRKAFSACGLALQRPQHVQRLDVARALPDRVERRLAQQPRHAPTPRRSRCRPGTPAPRRPAACSAWSPSTSPRAPRAAGTRPLGVRCRRAGVVRGGQPQRERRRRLRLQRQVGQYVAHQRLVDQQPAERAAVRRVVDRPAPPPAASARPSPMTQSSRVAATISMMVRTPRPSSPTRRAQVSRRTRPRWRRWSGCPACPSAAGSRKTLRVPSGSTRGTRKQVSPPGRLRPAPGSRPTSAPSRTTCARSAAYSPVAPASGSARVVLARTSLPPCFSVMPIPNEGARLLPRRAAAPARTRARSAAAPTRRPAPGSVRSAGTAACVIDTGQPCPASACVQTRKPGRAPHMPVRPAPRRRSARRRRRVPSSRCQAGWKSTSSIRLPYRSCVRSSGGFSLACAAPLLGLRGAGGAAELAQLRPHLVEDVRARRAARRPRRGPGRRRRRRSRPGAEPGWSRCGWWLPCQIR